MLLGCGCSSVLRGLRGVGSFIRPEYMVAGACDGPGSTSPTGNPKATGMWMYGPGLTTGCYMPDDPRILQAMPPQPQVWTSTPELPVVVSPPPPSPKPTMSLPLPLPPTLVQPAAFDPLAFAKDNWIWIAGGVGAIALLSTMK